MNLREHGHGPANRTLRIITQAQEQMVTHPDEQYNAGPRAYEQDEVEVYDTSRYSHQEAQPEPSETERPHPPAQPQQGFPQPQYVQPQAEPSPAPQYQQPPQQSHPGFPPPAQDNTEPTEDNNAHGGSDTRRRNQPRPAFPPQNQRDGHPVMPGAQPAPQYDEQQRQQAYQEQQYQGQQAPQYDEQQRQQAYQEQQRQQQAYQEQQYVAEPEPTRDSTGVMNLFAMGDQVQGSRGSHSKSGKPSLISRLGFGKRRDEPEVNRDALIASIAQPLGPSRRHPMPGRGGMRPSNTRYVMVWSQKGGVGKTTSVAGLGKTLASYRPDQICAIDTNPDGGSLAVKVGQTTKKTILDLRNVVENRELARQLNPGTLASYFNQDRTRLMSLVLPPGKKATQAEELTATQFYKIANCIETLLPMKIVLIDCGTNPSSNVMSAIRHFADLLVIVGTETVDEATVTIGGLDALNKIGYDWLVQNAITLMVNKEDPAAFDRSVNDVVNADPKLTNRSERQQRAKELREEREQNRAMVHAYFEQNTALKLSIPYDPQVAGTLDLSELAQPTQDAYMQAAAAIVERLSMYSQNTP